MGAITMSSATKLVCALALASVAIASHRCAIGCRVSCHWRITRKSHPRYGQKSSEPSPGTIRSVDHSEGTISIAFDDCTQTRIPLEWIAEHDSLPKGWIARMSKSVPG